MVTIDSKYLGQLRGLPSGYLLDLLADNDDLDADSILKVLQERGYLAEEIEAQIARRQHSRFLRGPELWRLTRWFSLGCSLVIGLFNLVGFVRLLHADDPLTVPLLFFTMICAGFGFFLGYKMTTHLYQGGRYRLFCGFPVPVGYVHLQTGQEELPATPSLLLRMMVNSLVGVNLTVFPVMLIYVVMH